MEGAAFLPEEIEGWKAVAPDTTYDRQSLYDYIDGTAEVYLAYGFQRVLARRYEKAGEKPILVDIFDMGSPEDAFGVFSFERDGPDVEIGQGSEYAAGLLTFHKGRFFVSLFAHPETPANRKAVFALGRTVADAIKETGRLPKLISLLPPVGLVAERVRYFHTHGSLSYHRHISDENILRLGDDTEAVLAQYQSGVGSGLEPDPGQPTPLHTLLLVKYASKDKAMEALEGFLYTYLPNAGPEGAAIAEDGKWCAARYHGSYVAVVFEAGEKQVAIELLGAAQRQLVRGRQE